MNDVTFAPPETVTSPVRLILFDAVGTLIYPEPSVADVYLTLAREFGSELTRDVIAERFRSVLPQRGPAETSEERERERWRQIVAAVLDDVGDIDPLFDKLWLHFARGSSWRLFPDAVAAWPPLKTTKIPLGVASNFDGRLHGVLADLAVGNLAYVFSSAAVGYSKPELRFFQRIEEHTRIVPSEILLVGDDVVADGAGAVAAGWQSVLIDRNGQVQPSAVHPSTIVVSSLLEVVEVLRNTRPI